jgi:hypothetical protein
MNEDRITINGTEYVKAQSDAPIKIVILQRGWVMVGRFERAGNDCALRDASVIRKWGTTKGLGQIATAGPTKDTVIDKAGTVQFDYLTVVATLDCETSKWNAAL